MKRKPRIKPEEEWAKKVLERELQRPIVHNDDNSQDHMYDLRIGPVNAPEVAIEVVTARDRELTETLNIGVPFHLKVNGDWLVFINKHTRIKNIKKDLEPILKLAESQGAAALRVDYRLRRSSAEIYQTLNALHITEVVCVQMLGTGRVILQIDGRGGMVGTGAETVLRWVSDFLQHDDQQDVILKLQRSGAPKCHVFIPADFGGVPEDVEYYLLREAEEYLPARAPNLPPPITDVWIVHFYAALGIHWDGVSWERFEIHETEL